MRVDTERWVLRTLQDVRRMITEDGVAVAIDMIDKMIMILERERRKHGEIRVKRLRRKAKSRS